MYLFKMIKERFLHLNESFDVTAEYFCYCAYQKHKIDIVTILETTLRKE